MVPKVLGPSQWCVGCQRVDPRFTTPIYMSVSGSGSKGAPSIRVGVPELAATHCTELALLSVVIRGAV